MATNIVKKLAVSTVFGDIEAIRNAATVEGAPIVRVAGIATNTKSGINRATGDEWTGLVGQFRGINMETGEVFESVKCFMPEIATQMVVNALYSAKQTDKSATVEFGFDLGVKKNPTVPIGYEYTIKPLVEAKEASPLDTLLSAMPEMPRLAAPKTEPEKAKK